MADTKVYRASTFAPVNIAVIKYIHPLIDHVVYILMTML